MEEAGAAIPRIRAALDQSAFAEPVDQAGQRDRLDVEQAREIGLDQAFVALKLQQNSPLGAGQSHGLGVLVGAGPQQSGYITDQEQYSGVFRGHLDRRIFNK